jgi:riboflavin synthase
MFTGIVECTGVIEACDVTGNAAKLCVASDKFDCNGVNLGDSIAVSGVCLTVVRFGEGFLEFDVSPETLNVVTGLSLGDVVNLERAMTLNSLIGGHLVSGHVDGIGEIVAVNEIDGNWETTLKVPMALNRYLVKKGSITINGVSLTVNHDGEDAVVINLVPHTISMTNLQLIKAGTCVNIEVDMLARYTEKLLTSTERI